MLQQVRLGVESFLIFFPALTTLKRATITRVAGTRTHVMLMEGLYIHRYSTN